MDFDIGIIIAVVGVGIAMVGVVVAMMFWVRQEGNTLRNEASQDRKDILNLIRCIEMEMKDFHYKLIEIERNK